MISQNMNRKVEHALSIRGVRSKLTTLGFDITQAIEPLLENFSCPLV